MNIIDLLLKVANENEDVKAFIENNGRKTISYTYSELVNKAKNMAMYLKNKGIKSGDYVTILITMSVDLYIGLIALWYIGAIPVFFDVSAGKEHVNRCSKIIKPFAVIGTKFTILYSYTFSAFKDSRKICISDCNFHESNIDNIKNIDTQGALVTFTSGSTGRPKTVVRSHEFLINQYKIINKTMHYEKGQVDLGILPVFTLANLASGITTVIPNSKLNNMLKINAKNIVKQIESYKVNTMTVSPAVLKQIADYAKKNRYELSSIKRVYVGGGPVFPNMLRNLNTNIEKTIVYGSSEAEPISELSWKDMLKLCDKMEGGSGIPVGRVVDGIQLKIINKDLGNLEEISSWTEYERAVGEIVVTGENVLKGYYEGYGDKENKIKIANDIWHRTGDCGYLDEKNCLWLVGGKKSVINKGEDYIFPFAIQCALNMKFDITKSAVVKIDRVVALILEEKDRKIVAEIDLSKFGIDKVVFITKIPMDKRHGAKVNYSLLLQMLK